MKNAEEWDEEAVESVENKIANIALIKRIQADALRWAVFEGRRHGLVVVEDKAHELAPNETHNG